MLWHKLQATPSGNGAYNLENATFNGGGGIFKFSDLDRNVTSEHEDLQFKDDGLIMYVFAGSLRQYTLSSAWDVSTATFVGSYNPNAQDAFRRAMKVSNDGNKMYYIGAATDTVYEYDLGTAWDVSTGSYNGVSFSVSSQTTNPQGLFFKPDGTRMFVTSSSQVFEYSLSTAWDLSTASYVKASSSLSVATKIFFSSDGTRMYATSTFDEVDQYSLSAWNISTLSYVRQFDVGDKSEDTHSIFFKPDGTKMFVGSDLNQYAVYAYNLGTAWNISTAAFDEPPNDYFIDSAVNGFHISTDGLHMYRGNSFTYEVFEYSLGTAFELSTASHVRTSVIDSGLRRPHRLFFKPDGTKMYTAFLEFVHEYSLGTPWDISTTTYQSSLDFSTYEDGNTADIFIKPDGTKLYVAGERLGRVVEYDLSTPWDLSTATYSTNRDYGGSLSGFTITPEGNKLYIALDTRIRQYDLSPAFNINNPTLTYTFNIGTYLQDSRGLSFNDDGLKFFAAGNSVFSFDLE